MYTEPWDVKTEFSARQPKSIGFEALTAVVMKSTIFWDITPCSPLSVNRRFGGTYRLHLQGRRNQHESRWRPGETGIAVVTCHLLSRWFLSQLMFSTLKMEAICSTETSVDTKRTTWRYIPADGTLQTTERFVLLSRVDLCVYVVKAISRFVTDVLRPGTRDNGSKFVGINVSPKGTRNSKSIGWVVALL
jgi:hypothetical protein